MKNATEIVFVLDRSGSMQSIAADMCGGFDSFIKKQREVPGECAVTLTQFDDRYEIVYAGVKLAAVPALTLVPRGVTALLDAIGRTIAAVGERLSKLPEAERPSQVLFVIITDGYENASKEYSRERVFEMIKLQREVYKWEFVFLGANQDAIAAAADLGISKGNAVSYAPTTLGSRASFAGLSASATRYRSHGAQGQAVFSQADYDAAEAAVKKGQTP